MAIVSFILALDGYRRVYRRKRAEGETRVQLLRRVAAESFHNLSREGFDIEASLAEKEWERAREGVDRLRLALAEATGSWSELLVGPEQSKAQAVGLELTSLQSNLYSSGDDTSHDQLIAMRRQCATAYTLLAEIAGKLRYLESSGKTGFLARFFSKKGESGENK